VRESEHTAEDAPYGQVNVLDLLIVLAKHKKLILGITSAAALISIVVSLLLTKIYVGAAIILPPQPNQNAMAAALLGQLGGALPSGLASSLTKNPADLYVGILKSRTVADALIERFELQKLYEKDTLIETREILEDRSNIRASKEGLITIEVEDEDPKRAAALANAYVDEVQKLNQALAISEAAQRRLFFEKQLVSAKEDLAKAEVAFKEMQETTGLIKLDEQGRALIETFAAIRAQIAAKEVQLNAMRSFATENNPEYTRTVREVQELRSQLARLERSNGKDKTALLVPTERIPGAGLEHVRRFRDVKYHETLFELLAKQYELARVDEARDSSVLQVVDKAVEPDKKSRPKRALIVLVSTLIAAGLGIIAAFIKEGLERTAAIPGQAERLLQLRSYLRWSRRD
jgi:tyrosine-protein kinase Etk/Wzc